MHTYIHTYMYTYRHAHTHIYIHTYVSTYIHVQVEHTHTHTHTPQVELLPALPTDWDSGEALGLASRCGVAVDVSWSNGKVTRE
jgi:hypothetical protein